MPQRSQTDAQVFPRSGHHIEAGETAGTVQMMQRLPLDMTEKSAEVYRLYHRRSLESNAVDFGTLLSVAALLKSSVKRNAAGSLSHLFRHRVSTWQYRVTLGDCPFSYSRG